MANQPPRDNNPYVPSELPTDMRDLMIRLDERVKNGFETTNAKLDAMNKRADSHEERLHKLEIATADREGLKVRFIDLEKQVGTQDTRLHTIETTAKTGASVADWVWRIAPLAFVVMLFFAGLVNDQKHARPAPTPVPVVQTQIHE